MGKYPRGKFRSFKSSKVIALLWKDMGQYGELGGMKAEYEEESVLGTLKTRKIKVEFKFFMCNYHIKEIVGIF